MKVLIFFKKRDDIIQYLKELLKKLKEQNIEVYLDKEYDFLPRDFYKITSIRDFKGIVIVLGGDGTILKAAKMINPEGLILGVNFGIRGFLTEINPEEVLDSIKLIGRNRFKIDERIKLKVKFKKNTYEGLNEIAIITSRPAKLSTFRIYLNDTFIDEIQADGIIVATPTGSTAYSLSAGGPIIDPRANVFIINYICPFKLSVRPIIFPNDIKVKIEFVEKNEVEYTYLTIDGEIVEKIFRGDFLEIYKSENVVRFIRFRNDYYKKVRELLV